MSFLKKDHPKKRDLNLIVSEFLKTKKNIQENSLAERLGNISTQREMSKISRPVTEA